MRFGNRSSGGGVGYGQYWWNRNKGRLDLRPIEPAQDERCKLLALETVRGSFRCSRHFVLHGAFDRKNIANYDVKYKYLKLGNSVFLALNFSKL